MIAAYDAVSRRDLGALERLADPEIEIIDPDLPGGGSFRGPEGVRQFVQQWLEAFEELDVQIERLIPAGRHVVACLHSAAGRSPGRPSSCGNGHVWTVVGGRATRVEMYLTPDAALEAAQPH